MARWIVCGEAFIIGDVVRWTEPVWVEKGRRKKKLVKVGSRRITGEVSIPVENCLYEGTEFDAALFQIVEHGYEVAQAAASRSSFHTMSVSPCSSFLRHRRQDRAVGHGSRNALILE